MGKLPEDIKVNNIELVVEYDCGNNDYLQLRQVSPSDSGLFDIAILDKEQDERTGETKINLVQIEYLEAILADFKDKLKKDRSKIMEKWVSSDGTLEFIKGKSYEMRSVPGHVSYMINKKIGTEQKELPTNHTSMVDSFYHMNLRVGMIITVIYI